MAVGDRLAIGATLEANTSVLITTPSAGKMYGTKGVKNAASMPQVQDVQLTCGEGSMCEWLPQETIIFDAAQAKIDTKIETQIRLLLCSAPSNWIEIKLIVCTSY